MKPAPDALSKRRKSSRQSTVCEPDDERTRRCNLLVLSGVRDSGAWPVPCAGRNSQTASGSIATFSYDGQARSLFLGRGIGAPAWS